MNLDMRVCSVFAGINFLNVMQPFFESNAKKWRNHDEKIKRGADAR